VRELLGDWYERSSGNASGERWGRRVEDREPRTRRTPRDLHFPPFEVPISFVSVKLLEFGVVVVLAFLGMRWFPLVFVGYFLEVCDWERSECGLVWVHFRVANGGFQVWFFGFCGCGGSRGI
jgi:hypothetical protein